MTPSMRPPETSTARDGCPADCLGCGQSPHRKAWRTRWACALYKRTSLPLRLAFTAIAHLRNRHPAEVLDTNPNVLDPYIHSHAQYTRQAFWEYGYHRVFSLVSNLHLTRHPASLNLLSIGPRTEIELYYLWLLFGFRWKNLTGADLISTSAKIKLTDMSIHLPFEDNSFDVVLASHSLEKSRDPERTRDEIRRVGKPNAWILVAGDRKTEGFQPRIHSQYFAGGVYGFIDSYQLETRDIEYLNARSPHGYEVIFRNRK